MKKLTFISSLLILLPCLSIPVTASHKIEKSSNYKGYINPTKKRFPILAWYSIRPDSAITKVRYQEMSEAGFNISFSHFTERAEVAKALEASKGTGVMQMITCKDLESKTAEVINQFKKEKMVAGWFLRDEPTCSSFKELRAFKDRVLANDNKHLVYLNLNPNYASLSFLGTKNYIDYLRRFVDEVNLGIISFDYYPIISEYRKNPYIRSTFYKNLEDVLAVSQESDQPMWAFALSTAHGPYPVATREMLRLEVFSDLAYGAQCIQYFTYWNPQGTIWDFNTAPISMDGHRTHVYYLIQDLNHEIQNLAPVFLGAKVVSIAHTGKDIPIGTHRLRSLPPPFSNLETNNGTFLVSHLQNGMNHYLMILNNNLNDSEKLSLKKNKKVKHILSSGKIDKKNKNQINATLTPGDYLLFKWKELN